MTGVFETQTFQVCPTEPIIGRKRYQIGMLIEQKVNVQHIKQTLK